MSKLNKSKTSPVESFFYILNVVLLILLSLSIILPFLNVLALSFNGGKDAAMGGVYFWPRAFTLANYKEVFSDNSIINGYKITLTRTILGTTLSVFLTAMAGYALKCKTLPGRKIIMLAIVFTMLFGGGVIPYYMLIKAVGLRNNFWVFVIPSLYSAWNIVLMRSFFESIPISLEESAKLDGCGYFGIFFKIILPLSKPVISVVALFVAVGHWNDWFTGAFYITNKDLLPVQTLLQQMLVNQQKLTTLITNTPQSISAARNLVTGDSLKMATVMVTTLPIMCVYPFIQKYFAKGVMIGAIKE